MAPDPLPEAPEPVKTHFCLFPALPHLVRYHAPWGGALPALPYPPPLLVLPAAGQAPRLFGPSLRGPGC